MKDFSGSLDFAFGGDAPTDIGHILKGGQFVNPLSGEPIQIDLSVRGAATVERVSAGDARINILSDVGQILPELPLAR